MNLDSKMTVLFTKSQIREGVRRIAEEIHADYPDQPLTLVYVLNGSAMFFTDLCRELLEAPIFMEYMDLSMHRVCWDPSRFHEFIPGRLEDFQDKLVIIVTEMITNVKLVNAIIGKVERKGPAFIAVAALVIGKDVEIGQLNRKTYHAFEVNQPVFGYGIDPDRGWQSLPEIYTMNKDL